MADVHALSLAELHAGLLAAFYLQNFVQQFGGPCMQFGCSLIRERNGYCEEHAALRDPTESPDYFFARMQADAEGEP